MNAIWLAALVLGSVFAIAGARELRWKLINAVVILGCMGVGFGLGYAAGLGGQNLGRVPDAGPTFSMILGIVGAMGCIAENRSRGNP